MTIEVLPMPAEADLNVLPDGLYDTGERRFGDEYDITQDRRFHDCTSRKLVRIDGGPELPLGLDAAWLRGDGKRVLIAWDIAEFGETFGERARRLENVSA